MVQHWYVLRVRSRREKHVASIINLKGYEAFLPLLRRRHRWSDRFKIVELPLFQGYVFCRLDADCRMPILTIPNVFHFVGSGKVPLAIGDSEIGALQAALRAEVPMEPWPLVESGTRVRMESGPLEGVEGFLVTVSSQQRMVIALPTLRQSVAIEIKDAWLRPIERSEAAASIGDGGI